MLLRGSRVRARMLGKGLSPRVLGGLELAKVMEAAVPVLQLCLCGA